MQDKMIEESELEIFWDFFEHKIKMIDPVC
jgi:hypothetical protein